MSEILENVSAPASVHGIEANLFELFPLFQNLPQAEAQGDAAGQTLHCMNPCLTGLTALALDCLSKMDLNSSQIGQESIS